jgi:hypothetical protein
VVQIFLVPVRPGKDLIEYLYLLTFSETRDKVLYTKGFERIGMKQKITYSFISANFEVFLYRFWTAMSKNQNKGGVR